MKHNNRFSMTFLLAAGLLWAGLASAEAGGPAHVLEDINRTPSYDMGSTPEQFHQLGKVTLFRARTPDTGWELWRTDGTEDGTALLRDIRPGPDSGVRFSSSSTEGTYPFDPVILNGEAFFLANDGVHGWELWESDGTENGTRMVKDILPGIQGAFEDRDSNLNAVLDWAHAEAGGVMYFAANDGAHGFELWRTDGTESGTYLVKDIVPGAGGPFGGHISRTLGLFRAAAIRGSLLFSADDGVHGLEVWKTDGTPAGTVLLKDIVPGSGGSGASGFSDLNGKVIFWAAGTPQGTGPWVSDGTAAGTAPAPNSFAGSTSAPGEVFYLNGSLFFKDRATLYRIDGTYFYLQPVRAFQKSTIYFYGVFDGRLLLSASDGLTGFEMWTSDGTSNGTVLLKDINPGSASSVPSNPIAAGGRIYFLANDGVHGLEPWTSDGTEAGTSLLVDFTPGPSSLPIKLVEANGVAYLFAYDDLGPRLWSTDGTETGTRRLGEIFADGWDAGVAPDGALLLSADDRVHGLELWRSDGTEEGTFLVKDINPLIRTEPSNPIFLGAVTIPGTGERMFFSADDGVHGRELWVTDGTAQGTRLVKDIMPGTGDSIPYKTQSLAYEGALYFIASDGVHGQELWRSDGTEAGTFLVADIYPGPTGKVWGLVQFHGSIYFVADDGVHGWEIWKSDGTEAGTTLAVETATGPDSLNPNELFPLGDTLYISAHLPGDKEALWKTDGSQPGTVPLTDSGTLVGPFSPTGFLGLGDLLFFTAADDAHGYEPWVSDGTGAGTHPLADIRPGPNYSRVGGTPKAVLGNFIYFAAQDGIHGEDLWRTDGTETGTILFADLLPGQSYSRISSMEALDGTLYFTAGPSIYFADELWRSDGTEEGTVPVKTDLGGILDGIDVSTGGILFTSWDPDHGYEPWRSDGTEAGTVLAQDLSPGPRDSGARGYIAMGDKVFFVADDLNTGYEPWVAHSAILLGQPGNAIRDLKKEIQDLGLQSGVSTSLTVKLDAAAQALAQQHPDQALQLLAAFENELSALPPDLIAPAAASELSGFSQEITDLLTAAP